MVLVVLKSEVLMGWFCRLCGVGELWVGGVVWWLGTCIGLGGGRGVGGIMIELSYYLVNA